MAGAKLPTLWSSHFQGYLKTDYIPKGIKLHQLWCTVFMSLCSDSMVTGFSYYASEILPLRPDSDAIALITSFIVNLDRSSWVFSEFIRETVTL